MAACIPEYRLDVSCYICGGNELVIHLERPDGGGDIFLLYGKDGLQVTSDFAHADCFEWGMPEAIVLPDGKLEYKNSRSTRKFEDIQDLFDATQEGTGPADAGSLSWSENPQSEAVVAALQSAVKIISDAGIARGEEGVWEFIKGVLSDAERWMGKTV